MKKKLFNHKGKIALTLSTCLLLVCMLAGWMYRGWKGQLQYRH